MSVTDTNFPTSWKKSPFIKSPLLRWSIIIGSAIYLALAFGTMDVNWERAAEGLPRGKRFLAAFFPPNFSDNLGVMWDGIFESIWMAIISTVAGIALSIPVGLGLHESHRGSQNEISIPPCSHRGLDEGGPIGCEVT